MLFSVLRMIGLGEAIAYYPSTRAITQYFVLKAIKEKMESHKTMTKEKALRRKESKVDKNDLVSNLFNPKNGIPDEELFGNSSVIIGAGSMYI